ncbi:MAG: hypothetical protein HYW89_02010 [Candidatus Sungiibacteriota bacterium]|uniref:PilN domain-containing protein n=1 Tax=Candidatus Sungiibacteriota bacterium TaxID=2750080 RepID=A0A7T5RKA9_9BACT|nr:MAG: hypothetical protein HYW89_02010 [Candidatus Sungbacteria bacterium]
MADLLLKKESPEAKFRIERGSSFLFYLVLALFFLGLAVYGGLLLLNRGQERAREELTAQVRLKEEDLRPELLNQIFILDKRLKNLRTLLARHIFPSNTLRLVEADTHPQVRFLNFNLSTDSRKLEMSGETTSYAVLARQIALFERDPQVERVEFGGLSFGTNNLLGFKLTLIIKTSLLQLRP